MLILKNVVY